MIVQACLNGRRTPGFHPALPLTAADLAADGWACVRAGASELHVHPRGADGRESLAPAVIDAAMVTLRATCPGTLLGVSTGAWIESDVSRTRAGIEAWRALPDYASVNLSEPDAPAVMALLARRSIGVEAGLATTADALRLCSLPDAPRPFRVLIEIMGQDPDAALREADAIVAVLDDAGIARPVLLHGLDATVWPLVARAAARRWSTRVGLEDGRHLPDGSQAADNAAMVAAAMVAMRTR